MAKAGDFLNKFDFMIKKTVKTGILPLDVVLNGGIELGGCYALASPPGGGKSTLALQVCKNLCDDGRFVIYLDIEQGLKPVQIDGAGLTKYLQPLPGETYARFRPINTIYGYSDCQQAIRDIIAMKKENVCAYDVIFADSLSSLVSKNIEEGDAEAATYAADARPLAKVIKSIRGPLGVAGITLFNIVQAATNINGGIYDPSWVAKVTKAIEHAVDALLLLEHEPYNKYKIWGKKRTPDGEVDVEIGYWGKLYTTKARVGLNRIKIAVPMLAGKGCDSVLYLKDTLLKTGVFIKGTKYYKYNDANGVEQRIEGDDNYTKFVSENFDMLSKLLYDLGYFDLTNNATLTQVATVEPAAIGDGNVTEEELRNEPDGTVSEQQQFI